MSGGGDSGDKREDNGKIVFYYNREHRLARASQAVRDMAENPSPRTGLFGSRAGNRGNVLVLTSVLIVCAMIIIGNRMGNGKSGKTMTLDGNRIQGTVLLAEGTYYLGLEKTAGKDAYTGQIDIAVSPFVPKNEAAAEEDRDFNIYTHRIDFTPEKKETYSIPLPFSGKSFLVVVRSGNETQSFHLFPEK